MQAGCLYMFKSIACSNTVYYEELTDAETFLRLAQQHLKDYLYIHEYMLCKDGWVFLARLKTRNQIQRAYAKKRERYCKPQKEMSSWKIISEQMRLFIGSYVSTYNDRTGREGTLVKRPYERYFFETVQEGLDMIRRIRRRIIGLQQGKKMYRAKKGHYRISKKMGKGSIYLSSRRKRKRGRKGEVRNVLYLSVFQQLKSKVLAKKMSKLINQTKSTHKPPIPDI